MSSKILKGTITSIAEGDPRSATVRVDDFNMYTVYVEKAALINDLVMFSKRGNDLVQVDLLGKELIDLPIKKTQTKKINTKKDIPIIKKQKNKTPAKSAIQVAKDKLKREYEAKLKKLNAREEVEKNKREQKERIKTIDSEMKKLAAERKQLLKKK